MSIPDEQLRGALAKQKATSMQNMLSSPIYDQLLYYYGQYDTAPTQGKKNKYEKAMRVLIENAGFSPKKVLEDADHESEVTLVLYHLFTAFDTGGGKRAW